MPKLALPVIATIATGLAVVVTASAAVAFGSDELRAPASQGADDPEHPGHEHGRVATRHLPGDAVRTTVWDTVEGLSGHSDVRTRRGSSGFTVTAPAEVAIGDTIAVTGRVPINRQLSPQRRTRPVGVRATGPSGSGPSAARGQTTRRGTLRLRIFMGAVPGTRRVTVSVRRSDGLPAATRSVLVTVVDPNEPTDPGTEEPTDPGTEEPTDPGTEEPTGPQGDPNDWTYLFENGSRWNTCQPTFGWGYDPEGAPYATALDDLHVAFDRVEAATGLDFVYQGAQGDDINVDWGTEAEYPGLAGSVVGGAFTHSYPVTGYDVGNQIVHGGFFLDADATASPGTHHPRYTTWGQVMVHELLHVMGLHHSRSPAQLMHAAAGASNQDLGRGDLSGAAAVGAGHPCLPMSYERPEPDQSGQGSRRAGGTTKRIG